MVLFNYSTREITAKIVYYGPGLCGKTTNLQYVHENLPDQVRGKMLSLATKTDRTLFFDFLPIDLGEIRGMKTRVQLYTVPGQVFYNETRKLVLKGADGIVFVADSQETMLGANVESYKNLEENLKGHGLQLADIPHVIQFNKRDLPRLAALEDLNSAINKYNAPFYESVAVTGIGVQDTLKAIVKLVLLNLTRKYDPKAAPAPEARPVEAAAAAAARPSAPPEPIVAPAAREAIPVPLDDPPAARPAPPAMPAPIAAASPAADGGRGIPASPFRDEEIDSLVGEVEDSYEIDDVGGTDHPAWTPEPELPVEPVRAVEPAAAAAAEQGTWIGSPEDVVDVPLGEPAALEDDAGWQGRSRGPFAATPSAPAGPTGRGAESTQPAGETTLTEVVDDAALFDDPSLEVAALDPGQAREIVVPVQLGEGSQVRRFKLSIRLRLDPLD